MSKKITIAIFFLVLALPLLTSINTNTEGKIGIDFDLNKFLGLTDTPSTYSGSEDFCVVVNSGGTALEFTNCTTAAGNVSSLWYSDKGVTTSENEVLVNNSLTVRDDVTINNDLTVTDGLTSLSKSSGIAVFIDGSVLHSGELTQNCAGPTCQYNLQRLDVSDNSTFRGKVRILNTLDIASTGEAFVNLSAGGTYEDSVIYFTDPDEDKWELRQDQTTKQLQVKRDTGESVNTVCYWDNSSNYVCILDIYADDFHGDLNASEITLNEVAITNWSQVNYSGGGGDTLWYNVSSITTSNQSVEIISDGDGLIIDTPYNISLGSGKSIIRAIGEYIGPTVWAALDFNPTVWDGNFYGVWIRPILKTTDTSYGINIAPNTNSGTGNRLFRLFNVAPTGKISGSDLTIQRYVETLPSTLISDTGDLNYNPITLGSSSGYLAFNGGDITDHLIKLQSGSGTVIGTGSIDNVGLDFAGWGVNGTNAQTRAIDTDGGIFDFNEADRFILPVKSTSGNPSSPEDGQVYVNTADNKISVYAEGSWRDLATW